MPIAVVYELLQAQQLGVEVAYATREVVGRAHACKQCEARQAQPICRHGHAADRQEPVYAYGP